LIANLEKLKELEQRLAVERLSLVEKLAAKSASEPLADDLLQRLAVVFAAGEAVSQEIITHEPQTGWVPE
jgi:hypothetical protein